MTTTLENSEVELSKQIGDYWSGTTTSAGAAGGTTVVDTALMAKANDWISDDAHDMITSGTYDGEERKISSLDNSTGAMTVLAHGGQIASAVTYRVHRLFTASEKRRALIYAARQVYPELHKVIRDESIVSHNWLKDGSFEVWTSSSALTNWTTATSTIAQTTTSLYFKHGATSCKISTAAGSIAQGISNWDDLKRLAGHTVTFTVQGYCDTASCLRLSIYDGTTTTYSDYHDGDSAWTEDNAPLEVQATIDENPTEITFKILHAVAAGTSYVDDARVIGPDNPRIYIGNLGLAQNTPHQVLIEHSNYSNKEPWTLIHGIKYDTKNGYMYLPNAVARDYRLRILGIGYLDYLASGVSSTAWTATIDIDSPQLDVLVVQAALYLYTEMSMPNFTVGDRTKYQEVIGFWDSKLKRAINKYGMEVPPAPVDWGIT